MSRLKMLHLHPCSAPPPAPPRDVTLRNLQAGDEPRLVQLYGAAALGITGVADLRRKLLDHESFRADRVRVLEHAGELVGTVSAFVDREDASQGFLHLLTVSPAMQGRGLGRLLVCEALRLCCLDHCRQQWLLTGDDRVGSIRLYLQLGFRPVYLNEAQGARWEQLRRRHGDLPRWEPLGLPDPGWRGVPQ